MRAVSGIEWSGSRLIQELPLIQELTLPFQRAERMISIAHPIG